jgi:hypothetical protein
LNPDLQIWDEFSNIFNPLFSPGFVVAAAQTGMNTRRIWLLLRARRLADLQPLLFEGELPMNRKFVWMLSAFAAFFLTASIFTNQVSAAPAVKLIVLNPRGEITPPPVTPPSVRIADLAGKRLAIYWNGKAGGDNFWNDIEALVKQKLPNTVILRYSGAFDLGDAKAAQIAKEADAFFYGVGD